MRLRCDVIAANTSYPEMGGTSMIHYKRRHAEKKEAPQCLCSSTRKLNHTSSIPPTHRCGKSHVFFILRGTLIRERR